jgi:hypothetical protein
MNGLKSNKYIHTHVYIWVLFSHKEENYVVCSKVNGTGDDHVRQNKPDSERQASHIFSPVDFRESEEKDMKVEEGLLRLWKGRGRKQEEK